MLYSFPQICIRIITPCHCAASPLEGQISICWDMYREKKAQEIHAVINVLSCVENSKPESWDRDAHAYSVPSLLLGEEPEASREMLTQRLHSAPELHPEDPGPQLPYPRDSGSRERSLKGFLSRCRLLTELRPILMCTRLLPESSVGWRWGEGTQISTNVRCDLCVVMTTSLLGKGRNRESWLCVPLYTYILPPP